MCCAGEEALYMFPQEKRSNGFLPKLSKSDMTEEDPLKISATDKKKEIKTITESFRHRTSNSPR